MLHHPSSYYNKKIDKNLEELRRNENEYFKHGKYLVSTHFFISTLKYLNLFRVDALRTAISANS